MKPTDEERFENWLTSLKEVTERELIAGGIDRAYTINKSEARKWFNSGASPLQCFRENFEL